MWESIFKFLLGLVFMTSFMVLMDVLNVKLLVYSRIRKYYRDPKIGMTPAPKGYYWRLRQEPWGVTGFKLYLIPNHLNDLSYLELNTYDEVFGLPVCRWYDPRIGTLTELTNTDKYFASLELLRKREKTVRRGEKRIR